MKKILVFFLKNSECVLFLYNLFYRIKNKNAFYSENYRRQNISIFDYESLAQPIPYYPEEKMRDSNYYGYARAIRDYSGVQRINAALEHGLYLGDRITTAEGYRTTRSVIAMSQNRVDSFRNNGIHKPIVAIGPYIHYAQPLLSDIDMKRIKKELGRVLLVMPVHSSKGVSVQYNHNVLLNYIDNIRQDYDTVLICLHFRDIINSPECVSEYEDKGYKVVCAGNEYDYNFVRRLKSIILLSDYVISNSHGTNTGFCLYLEKPQTIVHDEGLMKKHSSYTEDVKRIRDAQVNEIEDAFAQYSPVITDRQKEIVDKYWGLSLIKSPDELKQLLEI